MENAMNDYIDTRQIPRIKNVRLLTPRNQETLKAAMEMANET